MMDVDLLCVAKSIVLQQQSSSKGNHAWRLAQALLLHLRIQVVLSVTCAETKSLVGRTCRDYTTWLVLCSKSSHAYGSAKASADHDARLIRLTTRYHS